MFASLKRAPLSLDRDLARIPGVGAVQTRVVVDVTLDVRGQPAPVSGRLISIPDEGRPVLNDLFLRSGRWIEPYRDDEVLASETFARANHLEAGDSVAAIINGRRRDLRIVGLALSPEYVYSVRPGELVADDARFGVLWMGRKALATAYQMDGGFNDVSLALEHGASVGEAIAGLDRLLEPYGGLWRDPARAAAVALLPAERDRLAARHGPDRAGDLPGGRGLSAERGPDAARGGAAGADRGAEGARLFRRRGELAFRQMGPGGRRRRRGHRDGRGARCWAAA